MKTPRYRPNMNMNHPTAPRTPKPPEKKAKGDTAPKLAYADKQSLPHYKKGKITLARFSWDKPQDGPEAEEETHEE